MAKTQKEWKAAARLHTKRLKRFVKVLESIPRGRFNMGAWGEHSGIHKPQEQNYCGTVACALGHAALDKVFQKEGLHMKWYDCGAVWDPITGDVENEENRQYEGKPVFGNKTDVDAGQAFFGLAYEEAEDLFLHTERTKRQVISQVKKLIANRFELDFLHD